ncbi:F-box protein At3g07870-like [Papaver somniferum]|uniref:F-box protein At3g07870-like n=1 Tax=Papaver somniferum TaxID=3469 RepID=UPI000E6FD998|nr:F-box protein At3g07870-like [Papaver somniferum]
MENLPIDIIENIFSRLSVKPTLHCKRVCKTWRNFIGKNKTGLLFAYVDIHNLQYDYQTKVKLYYGDKYEENLEQYYSTETLAKLDGGKYDLRIPNFRCYHHMIDSCNGLVFFQRDLNRVHPLGGIFNPVTGELLSLSGLSKEAGLRWRSVGFGYLPSTNEYKVVRCSYTKLNDELQGHVEVYTLGSQCGWRGKQNLPYYFQKSGIFANGAIHWIGEGCQGARAYEILAYNLADEKFKHAASLPFDFNRGDDRLELMGGNLCALHYICGGPIIIWAFKKKNWARNYIAT